MTNWSRAFKIHPPRFIGHTWSLSIEEQFYLLWPSLLFILLRLIKSRRTIFYIVAGCSIAIYSYRIYLIYIGYPGERIDNGFDSHSDGLLIGCSIGIFLSDRNYKMFYDKHITPYLEWMSIPILLSLFAICYFMSHDNNQMLYWGSMLVNTLSGILIMYAVSDKDGFLKCLLRNKILVFVGSISYGLYLYHWPVFIAFFLLNVTNSNTIFIFGSLITMLLACLSYYFIEMPALKFKAQLNSVSDK